MPSSSLGWSAAGMLCVCGCTARAQFPRELVKTTYSLRKQLHAELHTSVRARMQVAHIMLPREFSTEKTWLRESKLSAQALFTKKSHNSNHRKMLGSRILEITTPSIWFSHPLLLCYATAIMQHPKELVFLDGSL